MQQWLSTQLVAGGRFTLGIGPSHHWIIQDMLGLTYERPAALVADYLDVIDAARRGPGPIEVCNASFRIDNPMHVTDAPPRRSCSPHSARSCSSSPASGPTARSCGSPTSGRSSPTLCRASPLRPRRPDGPHPRVVAGVPVCLCLPSEVDAAVARANRVLSEATVSPNYQRLLDIGDADNVGDILAAGDESMVIKRLGRVRCGGRH